MSLARNRLSSKATKGTRKRERRDVDSDEEQQSSYDSDDLDRKVIRKSPKKRRASKEHSDNFDGQVVGVIVKAPDSGRVPPGQISQNTLDFLHKLKDPKCNDREWFKLHGKSTPSFKPVYRLAEQEWKAFIDSFTDVLTAVDPQIPPLPPKDVIHRIYRDMRFSNDKTPYKTGFSASFSRSGRKGIFAGLSPDGKSLIAAGSWCPGKQELATIRANILRTPTHLRLRTIISSQEFVAYFGEAKPPPDGGRQNIFGMEDELKVAPKGVDKGHKDIDLLKCRSFAVVKHFEDEEVLDPGFKQKLGDMVRVMRPFVHCLNDMMTVGGGGGGGGGGEEGEEDELNDSGSDEEE
ncbi:hypothetical protein L208DRAFT_1305679 [Tricholoma matsutake]|nr:hypothetical protein L208DRAFT_1305679 [Tricholoma matsutake 945]